MAVTHHSKGPLPDSRPVYPAPHTSRCAVSQSQVLYKRVCEYLELETRVEVLNAR